MNNLQEILKLRNQLLADMEANRDDRAKKIGDRVILWDYSGCISKSGKHHHKFTGLEGMEAIVIEDKTEKFVPKDKFGHIEGNYHLDLCILFPNGEEVYTMSDCVRRTDKYTI